MTTGALDWVWPALLVLGLVVLTTGVVMLRRTARLTGPTTPSGPVPGEAGARAILDARLASGEIDEQEYERRRRALDER